MMPLSAPSAPSKGLVLMVRRLMWVNCQMLVLLVANGLTGVCGAQQQSAGPSTTAESPVHALVREFVDQNCVDCHNDIDKTAGLALETLSSEDVNRHTLAWERVVRMLRARRMPPVEMPRPDERSYKAVLSALESALDLAAAEHPHPGRTDTLRRLNRTEYQNAIRDLLAVDVDVTAMLPADEAGHGFDNVTVTDLSPTLLSRYISAALKISRLVIGGSQKSPGGTIIRIRPDLHRKRSSQFIA